MRKLLSIGVVLALLVTFVVPVVVAAGDEYCCEYEPPICPPLPEKTTKTMAGAAVWTMLGVTDIMGRAVCQTTGMLACNLGGWSDELGIIATEVAQVALGGIGDLLAAAITQFLPDFENIGVAVGDILRGIAEAIRQNQQG